MATVFFIVSALVAVVLGSPLKDPNTLISFTTPAPLTVSTSLPGLLDHHRNLSCETLMPTHGQAAPQTTPAPYKISLSSKTATLGGSVELTVNGGDFRGLYIQARNPEGVPVGTFHPTDDEHVIYYNCFNGNNNAVAYISHQPIDSFSFQWSSDEAVSVKFYVTIVESYSKFWVGVATESVKVE